ncbi:MAG: hypothetical protein IT300_02165 [Dehalococcoidia bacterium]|nr:hypothetical protein [Dehalococcoidia bacterium]
MTTDQTYYKHPCPLCGEEIVRGFVAGFSHAANVTVSTGRLHSLDCPGLGGRKRPVPVPAGPRFFEATQGRLFR